MSTEQQHFEAWGIVSLFGHKTLAGRITEQTIGGETFLRLDVPNAGGETFHTQLFGKGAIYSIKLTDEAIARAYAERLEERPVSSYDVAQLIKDNTPKQPALSHTAAAHSAIVDDDDDDGHDDDDDDASIRSFL